MRPRQWFRNSSISRWLPWAISIFLALCLGRRMMDGLTLLAWPDEWENVLGATMLQSGGLLYRDFVNSHGPFIFMLSHLYGALLGWDHANVARLISVLLSVVAAAAAALSPGLIDPADVNLELATSIAPAAA